MRMHDLGLIAAAGLFAASATSAHALTIDVLFDDTDDRTVTGPFVGSASLTLDGFFGEDLFLQSRGDDPIPDGIYGWDEFEVVEFTADFGFTSFTQDDLFAPSFTVLIEISTSPDGRTFGFSTEEFFLEEDIGTGGTDFVNEDGFLLSFEPEFGSLYFLDEGGFLPGDDIGPPLGQIPLSVVALNDTLPPDGFFGTFGPETPSSDVPIPAALPLMALGLATLGVAARRRR
ncbi:MAG: VPLPA-CTERM sorting domain-containing protein [Pseudomonadota bacterium]